LDSPIDLFATLAFHPRIIGVGIDTGSAARRITASRLMTIRTMRSASSAVRVWRKDGGRMVGMAARLPCAITASE
jgi:hypothetical protein